MPVTKECARCGAAFSGPPSAMRARRFCGRSCSDATITEQRRANPKRVAITCEHCGTIFQVTPYYASKKPRRFCGIECRDADLKSLTGAKNRAWAAYVVKHCEMCGAEMRFKPYETNKACRFCSPACWGKWERAHLKGASSHQWKGGTSSAQQRFRASTVYAEWRRAVFERDSFTCMRCGKRGGYLHAHHVQFVAAAPELALDVSNGATVCRPCHKAIHREQGFAHDDGRLAAWLKAQGYASGSGVAQN